VPERKDASVPDARAERVLVVPTELFHRLGYFQGFTRDVDRYLETLFSTDHVGYRPRNEVEQDPGFKQLIPYVIFCHRDGQGRRTVFQYTRGTGQGEGRLHRKRSVGIGGHISMVDSRVESRESRVESEELRVESGESSSRLSTFDSRPSTLDPYRVGMKRELEEEVFIDTPYTERCVGLINDDLTEVGRVHLGVVHCFDVERPAVRPREPDILESGFRPVEELLPNLAEFETWSQICLEALFARNEQA
jgi:predicted NUDIX family phosphoesterase